MGNAKPNEICHNRENHIVCHVKGRHLMTDKDPFELWKKAFLIGLGATAVTVEKIQEFANELVERGEMTQKEAMSFTEDLRNRATKEKDQFETRMRDSMDAYFKMAAKNMGLV